MTSAQYRLVSPAGEEREHGRCDVTAAAGALTLTPTAGPALRVPFAEIASLGEPRPFTVSVGLADGNQVELSALGAMRTQLLAELRDGIGEATSAGTVGRAEIFSGALGGVIATAAPAEIRVHEDALIILARDTPHRIAYSFVEGVATERYIVTLSLAGGGSVQLCRLGPRTSELAGLLTERSREARVRTAAFLAALLPGLDPMAQRAAAALLRDGVAVPLRALDGIHPDLSATLLQVAALPDRQLTACTLARHTDLSLGFRQVTSVRRAVVGGTPWRDPAQPANVGSHGAPWGLVPPGWGPWAYQALGAWWWNRPMTPRANVNFGWLIPETEDLPALTAGGLNPTVLAFALGRTPGGLVVYEALNMAEPMTYVYQCDGDDIAEINRALDNAGFAPSAIHPGNLASASRLGQQALTSSLMETIPHDGNWASRVISRLAA